MTAISRHNREFLQDLQEGATVNIDSEGNLYEENWFVALIKSFFGIISVTPDMQGIAAKYVEEHFAKVTEPWHNPDIIKRLSTCGLLAIKQQQDLALQWSAKSKQLKEGVGINSQVADTLSLIEALHSPYIDEGHKRCFIAPQFLASLQTLTEEQRIEISAYTLEVAPYISIEGGHAEYLETMDRLQEIGISAEDRKLIAEDYYERRQEKLEHLKVAHWQGQILYEKFKDPHVKRKLTSTEWKAVDRFALHEIAKPEYLSYQGYAKYLSFIAPFSTVRRNNLDVEYAKVQEQHQLTPSWEFLESPAGAGVTYSEIEKMRLAYHTNQGVVDVEGVCKDPYISKTLLATLVSEDDLEATLMRVALKELKDAKYHNLSDLKHSRDEYLKFMQLMKRKGLSGEGLDEVACAYYDTRVKDWVVKLDKWLEAEATITAEMAADPYIEKEYKKLIRPELSKEGAGGTYFVKSRQGERIGVFKPMMEEALMPQNPRDLIGYYHAGARTSDPRGRKGHASGSSWQNEIAAYEVFADDYMDVIPPTSALSLPLPKSPYERDKFTYKKGSFQFFAPGADYLRNKEWIRKLDIPQEEVEKMMIFDMLAANGDRHEGNFLYDRANEKVYLIDNGLIALSNLDFTREKIQTVESYTKLHTYLFSKCQEPLSERAAKYIEDLNIEEKAAKMRACGMSEGAIREFKLRAYFLKEGVAQEVNLWRLITSCMQNGIYNPDEELPIQQLVRVTKARFGKNRFSDGEFYLEFQKQARLSFRQIYSPK